VTKKTATAGLALGLCVLAGISMAAQRGNRPERVRRGEKTITGVLSKVDPKTRQMTVTPADGPAIVVQIDFQVGAPDSISVGTGACNLCGQGTPLTFAGMFAEGSKWTLTYTTSLPEGAATWFPGGTVNTVSKAVPVTDK
jgi:hypothetical protein